MKVVVTIVFMVWYMMFCPGCVIIKHDVRKQEQNTGRKNIIMYDSTGNEIYGE